jgi:6-pyruvoyltetrahydropterin/6-carboxytetrahydropterin synthase
MFVTRRAEFSASHVCRVDSLSESENQEIFGPAANPHGHGHNYVLEVTLEGDPDPITGMVIDLKDLKQLLEDEIVTPMDHRFLNHEVKPFDTVIPTTENIAREIWRRLEAQTSKLNASLAKIRLFETPDLYVDIARDQGAA